MWRDRREDGREDGNQSDRTTNSVRLRHKSFSVVILPSGLSGRFEIAGLLLEIGSKAMYGWRLVFVISFFFEGVS